MTGVISSRTPEGSDNRCPICAAAVRIEPSQPTSDAPCPHCGSLLWFYVGRDAVRLYDAHAIAPVRERLRAIIAEQLNVDIERVQDIAGFVKDLGTDSLEDVELIMALEEEFDLQISDADAESIINVADLIDYLERRLQ